MIKLDAILKYDPQALTGNSDKMFKPWWLIGFVGGEVAEYYAWFLRKRTGIVLQRPAWGSHVSIVRGEAPPCNTEAWKRHDGQSIELEFDPSIRTNGAHWWLKVTCDSMLDIREELGLSRTHDFSLHLTLGRPTPLCQDASNYYHEFFTNFV